jgi:hypothetical protein
VVWHLSLHARYVIGDFDLFILGDSIPPAHKEALIRAFRSRCPGLGELMNIGASSRNLATLDSASPKSFEMREGKLMLDCQVTPWKTVQCTLASSK